MPLTRNLRALALPMAILTAAMTLALASPARALECGETFVEDTYEERSRVLELDGQTVTVTHIARTYTVEGESRPFYRFVASYADRNYVDQNGDTNDMRAGLDERFTGHYFINYQTGQEAWNGQTTLSPDEQACAILDG